MSRIEATLYQVLADCNLHKKYDLHGPSTDESNIYYLYEPDDLNSHSGIHVSDTLGNTPHAAALRGYLTHSHPSSLK